jgi:hypothetical protein
MSARPIPFAKTQRGEIPSPFSPLLDMSRDVPVPAPRTRPAPIQFPDPEAMLREREQRARAERANQARAEIDEHRQAEAIGSAFVAGRDEGERTGYVCGTKWGMCIGLSAGALLGAAGVIAVIKLGMSLA